MGKMRRDVVGAVFLVLLSVQVVFAGTGGRVKGTVVDENGIPVAGVTITLTSKATNFYDTTTTNEKGKFAYYFVDATETYNLLFEKEGHQSTDVPLDPQVGGNLKLHVEVPTEKSDSKGGEIGGEPVLGPGAEAFNLGVVAARAGDREMAKERFLEAIKIEPELVEPYAALAAIFRDEGDDTQAIELAEKALEKQPDDARALMVLYDVYNTAGDQERADAFLERVRSAGGGMEAAIRIYNVGAETFRAGDLDAAAARFEEALQIAPDMAAADAALGTIYLAQGNAQAALDAANAALAVEPENTGALRTKYNSLQALGDEEGAAETLALMAQSDSVGTAEAFYSRGRQAFDTGQIESAMESLSKAVEVDPRHAAAHFTLGLCYINSGDPAKARSHLQTFLDIEPDHPEAENAREMLKYTG